jgi:hypothetical protein
MIALEVLLNGKLLCVAGAEDLGVLTAAISAVGKLGSGSFHSRPGEAPDLMARVGGLTSREDPAEDVHFEWFSSMSMQLGDVFQIRIIDTEAVDKPVDQRSAHKTPEQGPRAIA